MSVTLPIPDIDFLADSEKLFIDTHNLQFMPLNWARGDVQYLRTETDPNYPDLSTIWVRVDAYPTLPDDSEIVKRNGRYYDMSLTVPTKDLEEGTDGGDPINPGAQFDAINTLRANGNGPYSNYVQVGDTYYVAITATDLVGTAKVTVELDAVGATANVVGSATVDISTNHSAIVAVKVTAVSSATANITALIKSADGTILTTSRSIDVPEIAAIPTTVELVPATAEVGGASFTLDYDFAGAKYSGKAITVDTSSNGAVAYVYDPLADTVEDGKLHVKFDPSKLTDKEVVIVSLTVDGLTATSDLTYNK